MISYVGFNDVKRQQELCEKYLEKARKKFSADDIPDTNDEALYRALAIKYLRRRRIVYINAKEEPDATLLHCLDPYFWPKFFGILAGWVLVFILMTVLFGIRGFVLFCMIYIAAIFIRLDLTLNIDVTRRDLKIAARCVAICEILEKRSPKVCNDNWAGDPETMPGPPTDMKQRSLRPAV